MQPQIHNKMILNKFGYSFLIFLISIALIACWFIGDCIKIHDANSKTSITHVWIIFGQWNEEIDLLADRHYFIFNIIQKYSQFFLFGYKLFKNSHKTIWPLIEIIFVSQFIERVF